MFTRVMEAVFILTWLFMQQTSSVQRTTRVRVLAQTSLELLLNISTCLNISISNVTYPKENSWICALPLPRSVTQKIHFLSISLHRPETQESFPILLSLPHIHKLSARFVYFIPKISLVFVHFSLSHCHHASSEHCHPLCRQLPPNWSSCFRSYLSLVP